MESVQGVNVPMYTTLRRTTVVFTMIVECILVRQRYRRPIVGSVGLIVLGAFIAGARDLSFDSYGYVVVLLSNITTAIYLATIARIGKSSELNSFGLMWCNGILCGPVLLLWTFIHGDLEMTMNFPNVLSPGFLGTGIVPFASWMLGHLDGAQMTDLIGKAWLIWKAKCDAAHGRGKLNIDVGGDNAWLRAYTDHRQGSGSVSLEQASHIGSRAGKISMGTAAGRGQADLGDMRSLSWKLMPRFMRITNSWVQAGSFGIVPVK